MLKYIRGTCLVEITGASCEACLNRWTGLDLPFWRLEILSPLCLRCRIYTAHRQSAARAAAKAQCDFRVLERRGLPVLAKELTHRPILTFGLILVLSFVYWAQNLVWFIQTEGTAHISPETISRELSQEGVKFGAWGPDLDTEYLKNRMLNRVPELRWLAVNREGCLVRVLTAERDLETPRRETGGAAHVTATRPGVVTELRVLNGFPQVEPGDPVQQGDILISGRAEWPTHIQYTRAEGEVYARTLREMDLFVPCQAMKKSYTGREEVVRTLIFQRNRRKISGNSGIFGTTCDKMIDTGIWTLPGGFDLPFTLETVTLREYTLTPCPLEEQRAADLLNGEALRLTQEEMLAGKVESKTATIQKDQNGYTCRAAIHCLELISRILPADPLGEEEQHGETYQRGEN